MKSKPNSKDKPNIKDKPNLKDKPQLRDRPRDHEQIKKRINSLADLSSYGAKDLVKDAERLAKSIGDLKTAQIRNIYGTVKGLEMDFKGGAFNLDRVILLRPKLAYAANKKREVSPLQEVLDACIGKIREGDEGKKDFERFVNFFEAILAYHREHGRR